MPGICLLPASAVQKDDWYRGCEMFWQEVFFTLSEVIFYLYA